MEFKYLDATFDVLLSRIEGMKWRPWVGDKYQCATPRLIVLGESHYNWGEDAAERLDAERRLNNPNFNRELIEIDHGIDRGIWKKRTTRFYRNIESLLFQTSDPAVAATNIFWRRAAYFNLLQVPMQNKKTRPQSPWNDCVSGWNVALKICRVIKPTHVLVGGSNQCSFNALKHVLAETGGMSLQEVKHEKVDRGLIRYVRASIFSSEVSFVFIRHPSGFLNWKKWGGFINQYTPDLMTLAERCCLGQVNE